MNNLHLYVSIMIILSQKELTYQGNSGFFSLDFAVNPQSFKQFVFRNNTPKIWFKYIETFMFNSLDKSKNALRCFKDANVLYIVYSNGIFRKSRTINSEFIVPAESKDWFLKTRCVFELHEIKQVCY